MIYLTNGNMPLNEAYNDEIVQEHNNTYQLTFKFPTSDPKWELLKEEVFLTADDLHGEQDFVIFEVEKKHGYIQVYANQVFSLLNNYVVNAINLDRETGTSALSRFAGSITRSHPFSFFSDIEDRHTFNIDSKNAMEAFAKDKHSILGQWGGDLVRHGYQVRLLKNGGSENESLFMYKKNLSSYQHKTSTKSLRTRITFKTTIKGEGEKAPDKHNSVTIESSLINKYNQIYEDVVEVNDQDVKDEASLRKYGEQYFRTTLCDMLEDSLEIEVVGQSDVPVQMFDVVSIYHEGFGLDVRKKITKYTYTPMAKKLKSIGFGQFKSGLANAIGNMVSDALKNETQGLLGSVDAQIAKELRNAYLAFDRHKEELVNQFTDGLNAAKARAEEVKRELSDTINQRFDNFDNASIQEAKRRAEEALRNAGASSLLAQEAKRIGLDSVAKLEAFKSQATNVQTALSGDLDTLKLAIANDIRPKQAQAEAEIAKQVEALNKTKNELAGVKSAQSTYEETTTRRLAELTNLANGKASKSELTQTAEELASKIASVQVAHRNQGDRVSAIESNFKQRADALDAGVRSLTEGLRTKADISALNVTAENIRQSVKSLETDTQNKLNQKLSQAEFEVQAGSIRQEILNATKDKADKTLVVAEAGKLREEFSNLRVGGTNLLKGSKGPFLPDRKPANFDNAILYVGQTSIYMEQGQEYIISAKTDGTFTAHHDGNKESDNVVLWIMDKDVRNYQIVSDLKTGTTGTKIIWNKPTGIYHLRVNTYHKEATKSVWDVKIEKGNVATDWSPAPEDTDGLITEAKATFERTAQGLRTDLSAIQEYVNRDGQRQDVLQRYAREESAKQVTAVREFVNRDFVGKSAYQEDVRGLERKFEAITNPKNGLIATQIATYKNAVDGRFTDITSLISGKANQTDFQRVKETSQLYERILGNSENGIADKVARMAMTNQLFQVEVGKAFAEHQNLFLTSTLTKGFLGNNGIISVANATQKEVTSDFISVDPNEKIIFQHWVTLPENGMAWTAWQFFDKNKNPIDNRKPGLNAYKTTVGKQHNINQITVPANAYFVRFSARMYDDGLIKVEHGSVPSDYSVAPNDALEAVKTVQRQLAGSWAVQNINGVGSIVSQINATNNQILIEAEKIRLKGKTLLDELTAIQGYFKRLFVGDASVGTLNSDIIKSNSITADKLVMDMAMARRFVSSDIFTDTLAAKEAFINKLRSVVVTANLLEGFQGLIGGFRFGQYTNRNGYFITGIKDISVGMGNGENAGANRNAFWANWGNNLDIPGPKAWYVNTDGKMYCRNEATFHSKVDFSSISNPNFYSKIKAHKGVWVGTDDVNGEGDNPAGGYNAVVWWSQIVTGKWRQHAGITTGSDRKLKENIGPTLVKALDKINALNLVAFDYIKDKTHEEIGLIAQEVLNIIPGAVEKYEGEDNHLTINYSKFVPYLIKAVQELNQKIEEMEKIVA